MLKEAEAIKMKKAFNIFGKEVEIAGSAVGGAGNAAARSDSAQSWPCLRRSPSQPISDI